MIGMMREERCASEGLLLEGKKTKLSNLLQRLGFDHFIKSISFLTTTSTISVLNFILFCYNL
jgi:hypothetical protein